MPNTPLQNEETKTQTTEEAPYLKGTFIAVLIVGACLVATWLGVWGLFLNR
ncbi:cytochrome c oxidase subunit 2A [Pontibacillus yanchengensis]|uniref:Subunit I/II of b(O/a)3-type cytochrome C oxidase n=1 Tax=Pontibacillus yanchengensis Y32 TaxID=1385514 RepID=A0A0A2T4T0_9BACI|nr:cytochrome c oxidase subunit 2A [Pontibacillus yanchengensis]KGP70792.1 subunit I/II of b(o/a)3-type cytochrome C oxidase [Pontibacillus yanchengensis Y32]